LTRFNKVTAKVTGLVFLEHRVLYWDDIPAL